MTKEVKEKRIAYWGRTYLDSTQESLRLAMVFQRKNDYFTAYMYLFVAFNNLYSLLAGF